MEATVAPAPPPSSAFHHRAQITVDKWPTLEPPRGAPLRLVLRCADKIPLLEWTRTAPTQNVLAVRMSPDGRREAAKLRWGLIPSWAQDRSIGNKLINARSETIAQKPAFRSAFRAKRRCLIPSDGFFEWKTEGRKKRPFLIQRPDQQPFGFAGLWEKWDGPDGPVESCTILTTDANERIAPLHDRMPVILTAKAEFESWLTADDVSPLLRSMSDAGLTLRAVRDVVNNPRNDDPRCLESDVESKRTPDLFGE